MDDFLAEFAHKSAIFCALGWFPPALAGERRAELKAAVQGSPSQAGIDLSNWNWKVVRQFVEERFRLTLSRSSCLNYPRLHGGRLCTGWGLC